MDANVVFCSGVVSLVMLFEWGLPSLFAYLRRKMHANDSSLIWRFYPSIMILIGCMSMQHHATFVKRLQPVDEIRNRVGGAKPREGPIPEEGAVAAGAGAGAVADGAEAERPLDKTFGFGKNFGAKYELGKEVGRGHFGHTCSAVVKKGEYKGQTVAVKIISKAKVRDLWWYAGFKLQLWDFKIFKYFEVDFATLSGKADNDIIVLVQVVSHLKNTRAAVTTLLVLLVLITELEISGPFAICNQQDRYLSSEGRSKEATSGTGGVGMTTAISIEDVRREVKILKALSGHNNLVKFYDACEDALNVYIVMELCEGGELLDRILARGGRYTEEDAKAIVVQILSVVAFCHLQGVVHRDLKPENFLFTTRDENAPMKLIDFGLSDFIRPDERLNDIVGSAYYVAPEVLHRSYNERLNDIVGSAYYVAPEVLHRSYSMEADIWSIGVITYILLCGSRPFWARTESGIFRSVLRADPNLDDSPWPSVSAEAKDFVKRFLNKDYRKRMTAVQALTHPWLRDDQRQIPLDILVYRLIKQYLRATPLKRLALKSCGVTWTISRTFALIDNQKVLTVSSLRQALSKALKDDELLYLRLQFDLLEPRDGVVSLDNFRTALTRYLTDAMKESRILEFLHALEPLAYRSMDFEEFCAAAISPYQLEALDRWEEIAGTAFQHFEQEGNRVISVEELAQCHDKEMALRMWLSAHARKGGVMIKGKTAERNIIAVHSTLVQGVATMLKTEATKQLWQDKDGSVDRTSSSSLSSLAATENWLMQRGDGVDH
uniref:CDPK-related protein kinase n=1 Tax=Aegilops tauschii TaxID=37682 RepID=R7WAR1_AEGTA